MLLHAGTKLWVYCTNNHQEILNGKPDPRERHEWGRSVWNQPKKKRWYREEESPVMVRKTTEEALIVRRSGESGGRERQMGEAGASVFSSCLLAHTLTTRLRPLRLSLFVSTLPLHYQSPSFSVSRSHLSCRHLMTVSNHAVKNTGTALDRICVWLQKQGELRGSSCLKVITLI